MAILNVTFGGAGTSGQQPSIVYIQTNDTLAAVTTAGYLNGLVRENMPISTTMIACVSTKTTPNASTSATGWFDISVSSGVWSLSASESTSPLASGHIFVGNASNVATDVAMSGDATMANTGALTIAAGAVSSSKVASSLVQYVRVNITLATFLAMYDTPITLVAAGGANTINILEQLQIVQNYGSAALASGGVSAVQYDVTAHGAGVIASTTLSAATYQATASGVYTYNPGVVVLPLATCANKALALSCLTGDFTTGTGSSFIAHCWYRTVATV